MNLDVNKYNASSNVYVYGHFAIPYCPLTSLFEGIHEFTNFKFNENKNKSFYSFQICCKLKQKCSKCYCKKNEIKTICFHAFILYSYQFVL